MRDILGERDPAVPEIPTRVSEPSREDQLPKRFYKKVEVSAGEDGYRIHLDGRPVRTPGRLVLTVENNSVADRLASEWDAQEERIDPLKMPLTRLVNTAFDGVATDMQAVKEDVVRFCGTDLICYRAGAPEGLVQKENEAWDPLIDWAQSALGCRFVLGEGVMHISQPPESIAGFSVHVGQVNDPLMLAALHVATTLTGSATIAMALMKRHLTLDDAWIAAHVDEDWNIQEWGEDSEAAERRAKRLVEMETAAFVMDALT